MGTVIHRPFRSKYPAVYDALVWVVPAIVFGAVLRGLFLSYNPYAYWGADSRSYYDFAYKLFDLHAISLNEKRRFLYPIFLAFVELLPGSILRWLAVLQHAFGVITLIPLAYVVRKTLRHWRWWIVPVTIAYAGMPVLLWYEHELLAENLFFAFIVWAFAGWVAWVGTTQLSRARLLWWCFFVPFALFILTKPSARFYWPGICLGLVATAAWRKLTLPQGAALAALMVITLFVGSKKQGAWLLYVASFPLTRLETSLHAEYKAEIRDLVSYCRKYIDAYYDLDELPFEFLRDPDAPVANPAVPGSPATIRTLWSELSRNDERQARMYLELALEGIKARPDLFLYLGCERVIASANVSSFKENRFRARYLAERFRDDYDAAARRVAERRPTPIPRVLGLPGVQTLPPYETIAPKLAPRADTLAERLVKNWVDGYERVGNLVRWPKFASDEQQTISRARPTFLGWWLLASIVCAFLPSYRRTFGVWTVAAGGYLFGVFLVSQMNPRYFAAAWPVIIPLLALPADVIGNLLEKLFTRGLPQNPRAT